MPALPEDLRAYLADPAHRRLHFVEGEIRDVELYAPDDVPTRTFDVDTYDFFLNGELTEDPEKSYEFDGYDLVKACNSYDPEGIFIWFPTLQVYGSWDCDHHKIFLYPGRTWTEILREPVWYFNGQWYPDRVSGEYLRPWANPADA